MSSQSLRRVHIVFKITSVLPTSLLRGEQVLALMPQYVLRIPYQRLKLTAYSPSPPMIMVLRPQPSSHHPTSSRTSSQQSVDSRGRRKSFSADSPEVVTIGAYTQHDSHTTLLIAMLCALLNMLILMLFG